MKFLEVIALVISLTQSLSTLGERVQKLVGAARRLVALVSSDLSYENLYLNVLFDICDAKGEKAVVVRRQRVKFLVRDGGVIRDLAWGQGKPLVDYSVEGAKYLGSLNEGNKQVMLLGLPRIPVRGETATVCTRRLVRNAGLRADGYAEMLVERPTANVGLTVKFPRSRPPFDARLVTSPPKVMDKPLTCRYGPDGRPYLRWSTRRPDQHVLYSVRWRW